MSVFSDPLVIIPVAGVVGGVGVLTATLLQLGRDRSDALAVKPPAVTPNRGDRRTRRLDEVMAASSTLRRAVEVTANLADRRGALGSVERSLRAADVPVRPAELILAHLVVTVLAPILVLALTKSPATALFALLLAGGIPPLTLRYLGSRRRKRFGLQLPEALTTLAGSLRAGRSVGQALDGLSREMKDPMGRELRKVVAEVRLGRSLNETLADTAERVGSDDFKWAALAMQIQSEVGGNLAELLDGVAATMRDRVRMRGEVKALTSEGRASAMMLVFLVPALGGVMAAMNPSYMAPMFSTTTGRTLLGICVVMISVGYFWMSRMVKIDV